MKKLLIASTLLALTSFKLFALTTTQETDTAPLTNFKSFVIVKSENAKIPEVVSVPSFGFGFESGFAIQSEPDRTLIKGYIIRNSSGDGASSSLLFLAQPKALYRVYIDSDDLRVSSGIDTSLASLESKYVHKAKVSDVKINVAYKERDTDGDAVPDVKDNCVSLANSTQADLNNDGRGDECDDFDFDGVINSKDNCINIPNQGQDDKDNDGIGDACDKAEGRLTEKFPWLPWVGIGAAAAVLTTLVALTARDIKKEKVFEKSPEESKEA